MTRNRWIAVAAVAALLLFLLGYVPQGLRGRGLRREAAAQSDRFSKLEAELARTRVQRDLARAHGKLGVVLYEVNRNNFANASTRSTEFFDSLREVTGAPAFSFAVAQPDLFRKMLNRRDELSADLARADQAARQKLTEMYLQFEQALSQQPR